MTSFQSKNLDYYSSTTTKDNGNYREPPSLSRQIARIIAIIAKII